MSKCQATKRNGQPCTVAAQPFNKYCWAHAPENAEHRQRIARKAGKSKRDPAVTEVAHRIREVMDSVLEGTVDRSDASVYFQGAGVLIKAIEQARRVKETEELAAEVEEVKAALRRYKGTWGA